MKNAILNLTSLVQTGFKIAVRTGLKTRDFAFMVVKKLKKVGKSWKKFFDNFRKGCFIIYFNVENDNYLNEMV